jgi:hypothetical protein
MKRKLGMAAVLSAIASFSLAASASAAEITLNPNTVSFGNQTVGTTSSVQTITLNVPCFYVLDLGKYGGRSCTAPGRVEAINSQGDFIQTNNCVLPINNDSTDGSIVTCAISIRFNPTTPGPREGKLSLTAYGTSDQYVVPLTGTGVAVPTDTDPGNNGGNGGSGNDGKAKDDTSAGTGATGVAGKKCAKKARKGAKKAKCAKRKVRR